MKKSLIKAIAMFVLAAVLIAAGVIFLPPVTNYGEIVLLIIIGILLLVYVYGYLLPKVTLKSKGVILLLTLIEMALHTVLALTCIFTKFFGTPIFKDGFVILGVAMWIRGVVETFRAYYYRGNGTKYPLYKVAITVLLITGGTYLYLKPIITNIQLVYGLCFAFFGCAILLVVLGILKIRKGRNS